MPALDLSIQQLKAERGHRILFDDLSFRIQSGEALSIVGPNGCGKSTLLSMLMGFVPLAGGTISLKEEGGTSAEGPQALSAFCHYLGTQNAMKSELTVLENLYFWQHYAGQTETMPEQALEIIGLNHTSEMAFGILSTGMKRRVAIARLMVSWRPIWLLDEPTSGLDNHSNKIFEDILSKHLAKGGIIIAATHLPLVSKDAEEANWQQLDLAQFTSASESELNESTAYLDNNFGALDV